jgi:hypothetical protein
MRYLINRQGQEFGPYSEEQILGYLRSGNVLATDLCWREGMAEWVEVGRLAAFAAAVPAPRPAAAAAAAGAASQVPGRDSSPRAKTGHVGTIKTVTKVSARALTGMIFGSAGLLAVVVGLVLLAMGKGGGLAGWIAGGLAMALAVAAIVLGHGGQAAMRAKPEVVKGAALAVMALVFGYLSLAGGAAVIGLPAAGLAGGGAVGVGGKDSPSREEISEAILLALLEYAVAKGGQLPGRLLELEDEAFLDHVGALGEIGEGRWEYWGQGHRLDDAGERPILEDLAGQPTTVYRLDDLRGLRGSDGGGG